MVFALPLEDVLLDILATETFHVAAEEGGVLFLLEGGSVVGACLFGYGVLAEVTLMLATGLFRLLHH